MSTAVKETTSSNQIHFLISTLQQFFDAVWNCHHAQTEAKREQTTNAWHETSAWFWPRYRRPAEAIRGLADPAIAWCSNKGFRDKEHVATIEKAASFITELAMLPIPCAYPEIYANRHELWKRWESQGQFLLNADAARLELTRLAAMTGDAYTGALYAPVPPATQPETTPPATIQPAETTEPQRDGDERELEEARETKGKKVNARMLEQLQKAPDSVDWSAQTWAGFLKCSKSTVVEAQAWETIQRARALRQADEVSRRKDSERSVGE